jgi:hypothetical protein
MSLFPEDMALARNEPTGLGTAMAGGKGKLNLAKTKRNAFDYYPTPAEATRALLYAELAFILEHGDEIWEPCGRGDAIGAVLRAMRLLTIATDIVADPANNVGQLDILAAIEALALIAITNPPFALAEKIIIHLLGRLKLRYLALLLKSTFWQTCSEDRGRMGLYRAFRPSRRLDLNWRVDFTGGGASTMNVSWFIWDANAPALPFIPAYLLDRTGIVEARTDLFTEGT